MDRVMEDEELGRIVVRVNPRAKRMIFRTKSEAVYVSVPPGTTQTEISNAIEELRNQLQRSKEKLAHRPIDWNYRIDTELFQLWLTRGESDRFLAHSERGKMQIICPSTARFDDPVLQQWLHKVIEESLRKNAKTILPSRLTAVAQLHGFSFDSVKINSSRGRWGSCSSKKKINLSCFVLLLPSHLLDYVLLHELCHTREMNHGDRFWTLLNSVTGGKSLALRNELKAYHTSVYGGG